MVDSIQRFRPLQHKFPRFFEWISSHRQIIEEFDGSAWASDDWAKRVTPAAIEAIFKRPMPDDYYRFLRAFCYTEVVRESLGERVYGDIGVDPMEAIQLARGKSPREIKITRYDAQPEEFYPFAQLGCDGVSYDFCFLDDGSYVIAYFSPMDFDDEVPWLFPDMESFLIWKVLSALQGMEEVDEVRREALERMRLGPEFREGTCVDCAVYPTAFDLEIPVVDSCEYADACRELVHQIVRAGKLPVLERWVSTS